MTRAETLPLCPTCRAAIGGAAGGPDLPTRAARAGEVCGAADHDEIVAAAGLVVELTGPEAEWVDWALLGVAGYFRDLVDDGSRDAAPPLPVLTGRTLRVADLDADVREDLRYRLCEQAQDMAAAQDEAGARRMVRAARAAWSKIAAAWPVQS